MGGLKLDNERENHWRIFFEDNDRGINDDKSVLHNKSWDVCNKDKMWNFQVLMGISCFGKWYMTMLLSIKSRIII